jgi:hypothetical protein
MNGKDLQVSKYIDSWREILKQKKFENTENILIITNNKIKLKIDSHDRKVSLYFVEDTSPNTIFRDIGKKFKFPAENAVHRNEVFKVLQQEFVARKLVNFLLTDNFGNPEAENLLDICRLNRKFLFEEIFDLGTYTFQGDIFKGNTLCMFRSAFEQTFKAKAIKIREDLRRYVKNCWAYWTSQSIEEKLKLIGSPVGQDMDQVQFNQQLSSFMDKLIFVTSLEIEDIENKIREDLKIAHSMNDVSFQYSNLANGIVDLVTTRGKNVIPITLQDYENVSEKYKIWNDTLLVISQTCRFFENTRLILEIQVNKNIVEFLNLDTSQPSNILHIKTQKSETKFVSMQIYSVLSRANKSKDSYIMMRTSFDEASFERGMKVFERAASFQFMIIEIDSDESLSEVYSCVAQILNNPSKRLIIINDQKNIIKIKRSQELDLPHIYLKNLEKDILNKILNSEVSLQNFRTKWVNLANKDYFENNILLADITNRESIAKNVHIAKEYDKDLYISRTFIYKNVLKGEVLDETSKDEFGYSADEFNNKYSNKNYHWVDKSGADLKWIKTSGDISRILKHINEEIFERHSEIDIIGYSSRIMILVDIAGMGKSTILNHLAFQIKSQFPYKWVVKIDVNDYTKELENIKLVDLKTPDQAVDFVVKNILKLETDSSTGNIFVVLSIAL